MIPEIPLPSNPEKIISLHEATVKDVIDFAEVDEGHEEHVTTLFLNRMQDRETRVDAKVMTGDDRRALLFWYWIHVTKDPTIALSYDCDFCGENHSFLQDMRLLAENYRHLTGIAEREIPGGFTVRPLSGADMEYMERARLALAETAERYGKNSGQYKKQESQVRLLRLLLSLHMPKENAEISARIDKAEKRILSMTTTEFGDLSEQTKEALSEMKHGLDSVIDRHGSIYLLTPPHKCPNDDRKEAETQLRVPFRNSDYIPVL